MKKFFLFTLFFCSLTALSQEKTLLHGQLILSSMNTAPVNIVNVSTQLGTSSDKKGTFEIEVSLGDELLFSSIQYESYHLIITQEIMDKRWVQVELVPGMNKLETVTISSTGLSGNLKTDVNSVKIEKYYSNASFGFPEPGPKLTVEERRLFAATTDGFIAQFMNVVSGRLKKLKRLKAFAELDKLIEKARNSMTTDFFISECGVPEAYIRSFLYFCAKDDDFENKIHVDAKLVLTEFFKNKAGIFKKDYLTGRGFPKKSTSFEAR